MDFNLYEDTLTSVEELRELVGTPHEAVAKKSINHMDEHVRNFLAMSSLFFLSTADAQGRGDVSPRGDAPGFVRVLDDAHLLFPDRPGNRRVDSLMNIVTNPQVGLLFIIPGMEEVLRINGQARITRSAPLLEQMQWNGKTTQLGILVKVEECFIHCPRALKHSGIWETDKWPAKDELPSSLDMFRAHVKINGLELK